MGWGPSAFSKVMPLGSWGRDYSTNIMQISVYSVAIEQALVPRSLMPSYIFIVTKVMSLRLIATQCCEQEMGFCQAIGLSIGAKL